MKIRILKGCIAGGKPRKKNDVVNVDGDIVTKEDANLLIGMKRAEKADNTKAIDKKTA